MEDALSTFCCTKNEKLSRGKWKIVTQLIKIIVQ